MIYDLSSAEREPIAINSNAELYNHVLQHAATKRRVKTDDTTEQLKCLTCDDSPCNVESIVRSCQCNSSPCEGHECKCKPHPVCARCLVTQLWTGSNAAQRQRSVYRAKCPTCRAEYCQHDLVLYK